MAGDLWRTQLRTGTPADRRVRDAFKADACAVFHLTPPTVTASPPPSSTPGAASSVKKGWAPSLEFRVGSRQPDVCPYRGDWMRRPIAYNEVRLSPIAPPPRRLRRSHIPRQRRTGETSRSAMDAFEIQHSCWGSIEQAGAQKRALPRDDDCPVRLSARRACVGFIPLTSSPEDHTQVAPLVRLLVWLSDVINAKLELGQCPPTPPPAVQPISTTGGAAMNGGFGSPMRSSPDDAAPVGFRVRYFPLSHASLILGPSHYNACIAHGADGGACGSGQVNLRFLAEKQMLALSLALLMAVWIGSKLR